ncbi:MAG: NFACT RNA binding domain-containing protein [Clostridia bacterium]|nr:NFACT RNA binding domain-containing protein [Clostridia bacterium]
MPLDGMAVRCLANELNQLCRYSKIQNIFMPRNNEVVLSIYGDKKSHYLTISMEPSSPGIYLRYDKMDNPKTPFSFCMFLRKHIGGGWIERVYTKDYERVILFDINHTDELEETSKKTMIVELTGRNCNLIVVNSHNKILDALRHVDEFMSSVRRIMPASEYAVPPLQNKKLINNVTIEDLDIYSEFSVSDAIFKTVMGTAPIFGKEVCYRAGVDDMKPVKHLTDKEKEDLSAALSRIADISERYSYEPVAIYHDNKKNMKDFYCLNLLMYENIQSIKVKRLDSFLDVFTQYIGEKARVYELSQKSDTIKKVLSTHLGKVEKKLNIYQNSLSDADKVKQYKLYGEFIMANLPMLKKRVENVQLLDYYTNEMIDIPMDPSKDALKNAQAYYKKYKKGMAAYDYSIKAIKEMKKEKDYLQSVMHALLSCEKKQDIEDIRKEMIQQGYMKEKQLRKKSNKKIETETALFRPIEYISSEGYEIYAGRNNTDNDRLTFGFSESYDIWLHVKNMHGSHVIVKNKEQTEQFVPDKTLTEAAMVAAFHSEGKDSGQVAVDYTFAKNVKKPKGSKPGYVNYFNYYSAYVKADKEAVEKLRKS